MVEESCCRQWFWGQFLGDEWLLSVVDEPACCRRRRGGSGVSFRVISFWEVDFLGGRLASAVESLQFLGGRLASAVESLQFLGGR